MATTINWREAKRKYIEFDGVRPKYEEIASQLGCTVDSVKRHASREKWREAAERFDNEVERARRERQIRERSECLRAADLTVARTVGKILTEIDRRFDRAADLSYREIVGYSNSIKNCQEILENLHGDVGKSLQTLIQSDILPDRILTEINIALGSCEFGLQKSLRELFNGSYSVEE